MEEKEVVRDMTFRSLFWVIVTLYFYYTRPFTPIELLTFITAAI